jgi:hypothetical protein
MASRVSGGRAEEEEEEIDKTERSGGGGEWKEEDRRVTTARRDGGDSRDIVLPVMQETRGSEREDGRESEATRERER